MPAKIYHCPFVLFGFEVKVSQSSCLSFPSGCDYRYALQVDPYHSSTLKVEAGGT
jgi:hypothetical protein